MDLSILPLRTPGIKKLDVTTAEGQMAFGQSLAQSRTSLGDALDRTWDYDAFFVGYTLVDEDGDEVGARVNKTAVASIAAAGARVVVHTLALDYDLPNHAEWTTLHREEFMEVIPGLFEGTLPEPTAVYSTRAGARFVYQLSEGTTPVDAEAILGGLIETYAEVGIAVDPACKDWTRLFRLPRVLRDGERLDPWLNNVGGATLDLTSARRTSIANATGYSDVDFDAGDMPSRAECQEILGIEGDSELVKMAKNGKGRWIQRVFTQETDDWSAIFAGSDLPDLDQGWDNAATRFLGRMSATLVPRTTLRNAFALIRIVFERLEQADEQGGRDWVTWAWVRFSEFWEKDLQQAEWQKEQIRLREEEEEQRAREGEAMLEGMLDGVLAGIEERNDIEARVRKLTREEKLEWLRGRLIARAKDKYHLLQPNGQYTDKGYDKMALFPGIKNLGLDKLIRLTEPSGHTVRNRAEQDLFRDHGVDVKSEVLSVDTKSVEVYGGPDSDLYISRAPYEHATGLRGKFDHQVDEWLMHFVGATDRDDEKYIQFNEYLSHFPDHTKPICALSLSGAASAGKSMLSEALSEIWEGGHKGTQHAFSKFNESLLLTPLIFCDEGLPEQKAGDEKLDFASSFKLLVAGGKMPVRGMRKSVASLTANPRLVFAANDKAVIRALAQADLNEGQNEALGERLLHFDVSRNASDWLKRMGGRDYTEGWVGKGTEPGRIAQHIWFLFLNRGTVQAGNRFLVHGNSTDLFQKAMLDDGVMPQIATAFETALSIYEKNGELPEGYRLRGKGMIGVNTGTLHKKVEAETPVGMYNKVPTKRALQTVLVDQLGASDLRTNTGRFWAPSPLRLLTLLYLHDKNAAPYEELLREQGMESIIEEATKASL